MYENLKHFPEAIQAAVAAAMVVLGLVVAIEKFLKDHPKWRRALYMTMTAIIMVSIISFILPPSGSRCAPCSFPLLYHDGLSSDPYHYVTIKGNPKTLTSTSQIDELRLQAIEEDFQRGDSVMIKNSLVPYGDSLIRYFKGKDKLSEAIVSHLLEYRYLYIQESVDSITCSYSLGVSMNKVKNREIADLIKDIKDTICIQQAIGELVTGPLLRNDTVVVSLCQIYNCLCINCPKSRGMTWGTRNQATPDGYCDSLFFERGEYRLSLNSMKILTILMNSLQRLQIGKLRLEMHGWTDPAPVSQIPYSGYGRRADTGVLLCDNAMSARPLGDKLTSNADLAYARSYAAFDFVRHDFGNTKIHLYYTGHGSVNPNNPGRKDEPFHLR